MLVPSCIRSRCLPRTPLLKSRLGRSASGLGSGDFFILSNLGCGSGASTDKWDAGDGFSVNDEEDAVARGFSDGDPTRFVKGVLVIWKV